MNLALRLRSGGVQLDRREHDLVEVARRAVIDLVNSPLAAGREIAFEAGPDRLPYPVDALWFTRAVQNVVTNALVHNPAGTHVRVDVRRSGRDVVIAIADDGVGMAPATADRLFDRYARGAETSAGTGLGGAIARELVRAHGGDVAVRSSPGRGTTVEIRLPPA